MPVSSIRCNQYSLQDLATFLKQCKCPWFIRGSGVLLGYAKKSPEAYRRKPMLNLY
jgi:hypothetical protein